MSFETREKAALSVLASDGVRALYWIGSLAHGGFSERFSDIDVAVIFSRLPAEHEAAARIDAWKARLPEPERWSIFWSDAALEKGRMPVPDRIDLLEHGRLFHGTALPPRERPGRDDLRRHLREISVPYWTELASRPAPADEKTRVRLALYPARFAFSWDTGRISSNDEAVAYVRGSGWPVDQALLDAALALRSGGPATEETLPLARIRRQLAEVFAKA